MRYLKLFFVAIILLFGCSKDEALVAPSFPELDKAMEMKIAQYAIPGLSIAILKDDNLVYVQSYGYSDTGLLIKATNNNLYRIASVSKPITAIAILKLVESGLLSLNQKIFGDSSILGNTYGLGSYRKGYKEITIRHILDHRSGLPTNDAQDPMLLNFDWAQDEIIDYTVKNRDLYSSPGSEYHYSNIGYCILGKVIEKITYDSYENYVKKSILEPSGISGMRMAGNSVNDRFPDEVKYYEEGWNPYSINVNRYGAAGGWIASATDLARFMVRIDLNQLKSDILPGYLLGQLYFGNRSWNHFGSFPGTAAIINKVDDSFSFVLLANTGSENNVTAVDEDLRLTVTNLIAGRSTWPPTDFDLF